MGLPVKMQFAINVCGLPKVLWAAVCAGFGKLVGKHGVFYDMLGTEVSGLDGFYGEDIPEYEHMGVRVPKDPDKVCDEIYEKTGVVMMIVDANDLNVELLGKGTFGFGFLGGGQGLRLFPERYAALSLRGPAGGFLALGCVAALVRFWNGRLKGPQKKKKEKEGAGE